MQNEIWKDIQGFEGFYAISKTGKVKVYSRRWISGEFKSIKKTIPERLVKIGFDKDGYEKFAMRANGIEKSMRVHRAVAFAFIHNDNPELKNQVNHIDGNKLNNNVDNLEWCSCKENIRHAWRTGLSKFNPKSVIANQAYRNELGCRARAKLILDTETGIYYTSIGEAHHAKAYKYSCGALSNRLLGKVEKNRGSLIYA